MIGAPHNNGLELTKPGVTELRSSTQCSTGMPRGGEVAMRSVIDHLLATAASVPVLAILPFVAIRLSWAVSAMFGDTAGAGECCGVAGDHTDFGPMLTNPFAPGLLLALTLVIAGSVVAQAARRRYVGAGWAIPVLVPVAAGAILALIAWRGLPAGLSGTVPVVIGITAAACMGLLQATYTATLWALRRRGHPGL